ncbi:MAG: hypothetical protein C6W57_15815 [Caldibacillus debilis]|nr:hypothetical protein [Bacillaceae bacterium]OUM83782.1 MAG: hypothetical protein BAA03_11430 [Caldibacillus debilis]REJ13708.1 MAG: hypothetical protein C6W57_15815 [Caldibacillus debilis]REJ27508.1 MAG: hypothetical protein C6W56_10355 [Caldibacillus debilis]
MKGPLPFRPKAASLSHITYYMTGGAFYMAAIVPLSLIIPNNSFICNPPSHFGAERKRARTGPSRAFPVNDGRM